MLKIVIPEREWVEDIGADTFIRTVPETTLKLEHSLISISKWEAKWKKSYFRMEPLTPEEQVDYYRCMTINGEVNPLVYHSLTIANKKAIDEYIGDPMSAYTFSKMEREGQSRMWRRTLTTEVIYSWMIDCGIPFEPCEKWHFNRLMALIRVCRMNQQQAMPKGKGARMSQAELFRRNSDLNAARRAKLGSKG